MVYFLLFAFLMARVEPVFPYVKVIPQVAHNLMASLPALFSGSENVDLLADVNIGDQDDQDSKEAEKEGEKEVGKSIKDECKMLLHNHVDDLIFTAASNRTLFHLYLSGKERAHVNEVFRPPLV